MTPADIGNLIEQVRNGDPDAARALADIVERAVAHPDRRVGAVLQPKRSGRRSAATVAALSRGDHAIGRLRAEFFRDLGITKAADEIATTGRRYEATRWRTDRERPVTDITDPKARLYAEVLHGRRHFPRSRRVRDVLRATNSAAIHCPKSQASGTHDDLD